MTESEKDDLVAKAVDYQVDIELTRRVTAIAAKEVREYLSGPGGAEIAELMSKAIKRAVSEIDYDTIAAKVVSDLRPYHY